MEDDSGRGCFVCNASVGDESSVCPETEVQGTILVSVSDALPDSFSESFPEGLGDFQMLGIKEYVIGLMPLELGPHCDGTHLVVPQTNFRPRGIAFDRPLDNGLLVMDVLVGVTGMFATYDGAPGIPVGAAFPFESYTESAYEPSECDSAREELARITELARKGENVADLLTIHAMRWKKISEERTVYSDTMRSFLMGNCETVPFGKGLTIKWRNTTEVPITIIGSLLGLSY